MRLDWEIARRGYRRYSAYPGATAAGLFTNVFFGFLQAYILLAVYESRDSIGGYDAAAAVTYVWLTQGLLSVVASFGPSWIELALRVRSGDIAVDLGRPVDLQRAQLAHDAGRAGYQLLYRATPPFLLGALVFELTAPSDPLVWAGFAVSVALAVVVSFAIRFLVNLLSFWLTDYRGAMLLAMTVSHLLSGLIVPLAFFPEPWDTVARALPFASMLQLPVDIFVGAATGSEIAAVLAIQAAWAVVLIALGRVVLSAGTRKLVIQGG
jgi:ABC-2 type transport system permease protein